MVLWLVMEVILRAGRRFVKALASNSGRQSPEEPRQKKQGREKTNPSLRPIAGEISVLAGDVLEIHGPAGSNRRRSRSGNIPERQVYEDGADHARVLRRW